MNLKDIVTEALSSMDKEAQGMPETPLTIDDVMEELNQYGHPDMNIGGGAAMVLRGLRDDTYDIDASIEDKLFDEILSRYDDVDVKKSKLGSRYFSIPGSRIDLFSKSKDEEMGEKMDGVTGLVETEGALLNFYRKLNRDKDQKWIDLLSERVKEREGLEEEEDEGSVLERLQKASAAMPSQLISRWCWGFAEKCAKAGIDPVELLNTSRLKTESLEVD